MVKEKIPILLCKSSPKKTKAVIHMTNEKIPTFDKDIDLYFSTAKNYCIDIYKTKPE